MWIVPCQGSLWLGLSELYLIHSLDFHSCLINVDFHGLGFHFISHQADADLEGLIFHRNGSDTSSVFDNDIAVTFGWTSKFRKPEVNLQPQAYGTFKLIVVADPKISGPHGAERFANVFA